MANDELIRKAEQLLSASIKRVSTKVSEGKMTMNPADLEKEFAASLGPAMMALCDGNRTVAQEVVGELAKRHNIKINI